MPFSTFVISVSHQPTLHLLALRTFWTSSPGATTHQRTQQRVIRSVYTQTVLRSSFSTLDLSVTSACVHRDPRLNAAQRLLRRPWSSSQRLQIVSRTIARKGGGYGFYRWSVELMLWIAMSWVSDPGPFVHEIEVVLRNVILHGIWV